MESAREIVVIGYPYYHGKNIHALFKAGGSGLHITFGIKRSFLRSKKFGWKSLQDFVTS